MQQLRSLVTTVSLVALALVLSDAADESP